MSASLRLLYIPGARKLHVATPGDPEGSVLCGRDLPPGTNDVGPLKPDSTTCKGCADAVAAIVTIKRPDPKTGELVEELRAPDHFKPEKVELVSQSFRQRLLAGERPGLIWPGKEDCPVEAGQEIQVGSGVTITVYRIKATKGGDHRGYYTVDDDRPALPRRTPQMFQPPETDQYGDPIKHTTESIAAATIDGNYTQDPKQAVTGVGPEVDIEYRRVLGTKTKAKEATRKREEDPMGEMDQDLKRLNRETREIAKRAAKMGVDPTIALAPVLRAAAEAHAQLSAENAAA